MFFCSAHCPLGSQATCTKRILRNRRSLFYPVGNTRRWNAMLQVRQRNGFCREDRLIMWLVDNEIWRSMGSHWSATRQGLGI